MKAFIVTLVVLTGAVTFHAQTSPPLSFEVASIKPLDGPPMGPISMPRPSPERFTLSLATVQSLIGSSYQVQVWQVIGLPDWAKMSFFSINAKIPAGTPMTPPKPGEVSPVMLMVRSLLAERFQLKAHTEKREMQGYRLVLARSDGKLGPNLKPSGVDCAAMYAKLREAGQPPAPPPPPKPGESRPCSAMSGIGNMIVSDQPFAMFVAVLQGQLRGPVVDKTGLKGNYSFSLSWTPEQLPPRLPGSPADGPIRMGPFTIDPNGPSLVTAIQEQLGLKLESTKEQVDVLVVDSVSQPTPD